MKKVAIGTGVFMLFAASAVIFQMYEQEGSLRGDLLLNDDGMEGTDSGDVTDAGAKDSCLEHSSKYENVQTLSASATEKTRTKAIQTAKEKLWEECDALVKKLPAPTHSCPAGCKQRVVDSFDVSSDNDCQKVPGGYSCTYSGNCQVRVLCETEKKDGLSTDIEDAF